VTATSLDLSKKPELVWLSRLVADIQVVAREHDLLLVGAQARDLLLMHANRIDTRRATEDVDLAFMVGDWNQFLDLRAQLVESGRFSEHERTLHKLTHNGVGGLRVDLIPFAGVEDADRHIAWPPDGAVVMNVIGFREVLESALSVSLPEAISINVPPLPGLVLLKLSAWADRRLMPPLDKDAYDIRLLFKHYLEAGNQERLYVEAAHLLDRSDFDFEVAGAWLLGHDARALLEVSATATNTVPFYAELLKREASAATESILLSDMRSPNPTFDLRLLRSFVEGFDA
jgi:predicted nucleotidyltransferase